MPRSQAEVRLAHAVLEGKARSSGMSHAYAQEVVSKMHGKSLRTLPMHVKRSVRARIPKKKRRRS